MTCELSELKTRTVTLTKGTTMTLDSVFKHFGQDKPYDRVEAAKGLTRLAIGELSTLGEYPEVQALLSQALEGLSNA